MKTALATARRLLSSSLAALLLAGSALADSGAALETIAPDTALAEIQGSQGVVLLDVYAEW